MITKEKKQHTGDMRQECTVERYTTSSDGGFGDTGSWNTLTTIYANIKPMNAYKRLQFGQLDSTITHEIIAWHEDSITPQDRIQYNGRIFTLKSKINEGEEGVYSIFAAAEEV